MERFSYGTKIKVSVEFDSAYERVVEALKNNGFGVLTEIDVKATLKEKIGEDFRRYAILGACNPKLAFRALSAEEDLGLLLPCNVVVYESDDGTMVGIIDPGMMSTMTSNPVLGEVAAEAGGLFESALGELETASMLIS